MRRSLPPVPRVTAIIPCRNEADFIETCLRSVDALDYPKNRLEVFVCDGMSTDGTPEIVRRFAEDHPYVTLLESPKRTLASGWNLGLTHATGDVVCVMIAHQTYRSDYVSASVRYLRQYEADAVGGSMRTLPQEDTALGRAIAAVWSHPFGVGNAYFRIGTDRPRWVDNVHCGVFRRSALELVGGYDERLVRSQDADLQSRLRAAGGRILLVPESFSAYYTRSRFGAFARYAVINGYWVARPLEHGSFLTSLRHWVPFLFILGIATLALASLAWGALRVVLLLAVSGYLLTAVAAAVGVAARRRDARYAILLPLVFLVLHVGYGVGTTFALLELAASRIARPHRLSTEV